MRLSSKKARGAENRARTVDPVDEGSSQRQGCGDRLGRHLQLVVFSVLSCQLGHKKWT